MSGTRYEIEVAARLPERLVRLRELANNLWYSWDAHTQALFARIDCHQWLAAGHSPKAFLNRVDQQALDAAADDADFLGNLDRVLASYDAYHAPRDPRHCAGDAPHMEHGDLIAYFCAEFGFHESLPIYSGGLGILAADHCKTASDLKLPFVGIGLLYRQGYFHQRIDADGRQTASYHDSDFDDLPITPALRADGSPLHVRIDIAERSVDIKVWRVQVGTVSLYLLDTDLDSNAVHDRDIAHQLYGGDRNTRIEQEIVLGTGGVRVLRELGLMPTVWHINEGHAAFMIVERIRQLMQAGLDFPAAVEAVASNTVFTMHTSVPAGQEHFGEEMMRRYFGRIGRRDRRHRHAAGARPRARTRRFQHGMAGDPRLASLQRRIAHPRRGVGEHLRRAVAADRSGGKSGRLRHQRHPHSVLPPICGTRCSTATSAHAGSSRSAAPTCGRPCTPSPIMSSGARVRPSSRSCCT
jgi:starch phosphorylase